MQFKIRNITIKISFTLFIPLLIFIISNKTDLLIKILLCTFIHEITHLIIIFIFGGSISYIELGLSGGNIKRIDILPCKKEALIHLSAPIINLLLGLLILHFKGNSNLFSLINIFIGLFNILPFESFDGGIGLYYILKTHYSEKICHNILFFFSVVTISFLLVICFILYSDNKLNVYLFIMIVYLIFVLFFNNNKHINNCK